PVALSRSGAPALCLHDRRATGTTYLCLIHRWTHLARDEVEDVDHPRELVAPELHDDVPETEPLVLNELVDHRRGALRDQLVAERVAERDLDRVETPAGRVRDLS